MTRNRELEREGEIKESTGWPHTLNFVSKSTGPKGHVNVTECFK